MNNIELKQTKGPERNQGPSLSSKTRIALTVTGLFIAGSLLAYNAGLISPRPAGHQNNTPTPVTLSLNFSAFQTADAIAAVKIPTPAPIISPTPTQTELPPQPTATLKPEQLNPRPFEMAGIDFSEPFTITYSGEITGGEPVVVEINEPITVTEKQQWPEEVETKFGKYNEHPQSAIIVQTDNQFNPDDTSQIGIEPHSYQYRGKDNKLHPLPGEWLREKDKRKLAQFLPETQQDSEKDKSLTTAYFSLVGEDTISFEGYDSADAQVPDEYLDTPGLYFFLRRDKLTPKLPVQVGDLLYITVCNEPPEGSTLRSRTTYVFKLLPATENTKDPQGAIITIQQ